MPNFLGSLTTFSKEFAKPITKSYLPGANAQQISEGMEQLKLLHQQVLPFILRREKAQVLKELPPKTISNVPCEMSNRQRALYQQFLATEAAKKSVAELRRALQNTVPESELSSDGVGIGSDALKALLFLRLLCTHPVLVERSLTGSKDNELSSAYDIEMSGKFLALAELLRACGIHNDEITGADNDSSLLYCAQDDDDEDANDLSNLLNPTDGDTLENQSAMNKQSTSTSKCLVFAQFTQSLDAVEQLLVKRHMPSLRYLRLDGRVPAAKRTALVDAFNNDPSVKLMLLTTRVGGMLRPFSCLLCCFEIVYRLFS